MFGFLNDMRENSKWFANLAERYGESKQNEAKQEDAADFMVLRTRSDKHKEKVVGLVWGVLEWFNDKECTHDEIIDTLRVAQQAAEEMKSTCRQIVQFRRITELTESPEQENKHE